jgi:PASTA domain-containing protein
MAGELSGDVKVPAVGKVPKKYAAGGLVIVGTLIIVYYVRKKKSSAASTSAAAGAATSTDQYPPDGTVGNPQDPYSTDPATGQTYGDEAVGSGGTYGAYGDSDSADSGSYPWDGTVGNEDDPYSLDPGTGETYGNEGSGSTGTGTTGGPPFANNSDWENWALQQLQENDSSFDVADTITALGLYLDGQPVTAAQKTLIFDATGIAGDPPVAGPNNYPPNVKTNGDTGGSGATVQVPNCAGQTAGTAHNLITDVGLKPTDPNGNVPGEASWKVTSTSPAAGTTVQQGTSVQINAQKPASTSGSVTVPNVVGQPIDKAGPAITAAGLKYSGPAPVKGKTVTITAESPSAGSKVAKGSTVRCTGKTS